MLGLQQGSDSEDVHDTWASSAQISSITSHTSFDHGDEHEHEHEASSDGSFDGSLTQHIRVHGRQPETCFPIHLLSACSGTGRTMCPYSGSITSRDMLAGAGEDLVQGTFDTNLGQTLDHVGTRDEYGRSRRPTTCGGEAWKEGSGSEKDEG